MTDALQDAIKALHTELRVSANGYGAVTVQPCGVPHCPFMVRRGDGGWNHLDTHGAVPDHAAIGLLTAAAWALSEVRPYGTVTESPSDEDADDAWERWAHFNWNDEVDMEFVESAFRAGAEAAREHPAAGPSVGVVEQDDRLSSPPADDVREALAQVLYRTSAHNDGTGGHDLSISESDYFADAILAEFEVRPHGMFTDAEALAKAWDEGFELATRNNPNQPHPMAKLNPYRGEARS